MSDNIDIDELLEKANAYADFAVEQFTLEHVPQAPKPEIDNASKRENFLGELYSEDPSLYVECHRSKYVVHYLFPSLNDQDRLNISILCNLSQSCKTQKIKSDDESILPEDRAKCKKWLSTDLKRWREYKEKVSALEPMLTLPQIELLDSDYFNWPDNHKVD